MSEIPILYYTKGCKYQCDRDYYIMLDNNPGVEFENKFIKLDKTGLLIIKKGYAWDGASGPTWDSKNSMVASLVHDVLYQLMRLKAIHQKFRLDADKELYRIVRARGMWWLRAKSWIKGLAWFGSSSADPKNKKKVYKA